MEHVSARALQLIHEKAPRFPKAVQRAVRESRSTNSDVPVLISLLAFADDPELLYACLWLSWTLGATDTFVPLTEE